MSDIRKYLKLALKPLGLLVLPFRGEAQRQPLEGRDGAAFINSDTRSLEMYLDGGYKTNNSLLLATAVITANIEELDVGYLKPTDTTASSIVVDLKDDAPDYSCTGYFDATGSWSANPLTLRSTLNINGSPDVLPLANERGGIQLVKLPTVGWVQYGSAAAGGGGGGAGFGIGETTIVRGDMALVANTAYMVDSCKILTLSAATLTAYITPLTRNIGDPGFTLPGIYSAEGQALALDDSVPHWTDGTRMTARHPTTQQWMIFDTTDLTGMGGWYVQSGMHVVDLPMQVNTWIRITGSMVAGARTVESLDFAYTPFNLTLPALTGSDSIYIADMFGAADVFPFNLLVATNMVNGSREDILFGVGNASIELQAQPEAGVKVVRGMGVSQGGSPMATSVLHDLVGYSARTLQQVGGSHNPDFATHNVMTLGLTADLRLEAPVIGEAEISCWYIKFVQPISGGKEITWGTSYHVHQGIVNPQPNAVTLATVVSFGDGIYDVWMSPRL